MKNTCKSIYTALLFSLLCTSSLFAQSESLVAETEAEDGILHGVTVSTDNSGYSGTGYITGFDNSGDKVTVTINIPERAYYKLSIRYIGLNGYKTQMVNINNQSSIEIGFPGSNSFRNIEIGEFLLEKGDNTFSVRFDQGYTDIDKFQIYSVPKPDFDIDQQPVDPNATEATKNLYDFLKLQFGDRIISGQTHSNYDTIKIITGKSPIIRNHDFQHFTEGYAYLWKDGGHTFGKHDDGSVADLIEWYNNTEKKGIIAYQWHWHSPTGGQPGTNTFYTDQTNFDIREAVKEGTSEYSMIIRDIDDIAAELKKFQDANIPVLWRPLHEAGGGWFWWGAHGADPCLQLYNILFDRLVNYHQIHNLLWVWSTPEENWYPGNDKVDIIGFDSYPGSYIYTPQRDQFKQLFDLTEGKKLVSMSENGAIPDPDECLNLDAGWSYFMTWSDLLEQRNTESHIFNVYNNPNVLTLESTNFKTDNTWRSALYPETWKPGFKDEQGRFLHDFSYAGYQQGEKEIPFNNSNIIDVTQAPYLADNSGTEDVTQIIQNALNNAGSSGGGVVYLPPGKYRIKPQNNENYSLHISYDNVVLRGAGTDSTFLYNDDNFMRGKDIIHIRNEYSNWFTEQGNVSNITVSLNDPTKIIPVESLEGFEVGDRIIVRSDATDEFISEHNMEGYWTESAIKGIAFIRQIDSIDTEKNLIFIDSPTRYFLKTRDNARVYHAGSHLRESGIESLSIGNKQSEKSGWEEESYSENGTGAYDVHFSHVIQFKYCQNCWVKNVNTYHPEENPDDFHILSNCLLLNQCSNITVDSCFFQKPQYEGGGGNGYMFTLCSNDCLIKNCRANHSRHNYDFKYPYSNGNVIHNCIGENSKYSSDFHMYLSMSNLIDVFTVNGDYLESTFRPYGGGAIHGYSSTQSVFYNTKGEAYHENRDYIIESKQFGWGYIIGTSGVADNIKIDPVYGSINDYGYNTAPRDFYEGVGEGEGLVPWSLYLDQLDKRLNDTVSHTYSVNILVKDELSGEAIAESQVKIFDNFQETDINGQADFQGLPEMFILSIEKEFYYPVEQMQVNIYSDTTLTFYLSKREFNVSFEVVESGTNSPVWYASVTLGDFQGFTNSTGTTTFEILEGAYNYTVNAESYSEVTGNIAISSDSTIRVLLTNSLANVRFKLKKGSTPVNKANIALGTDTLISSSLGIASFYDLPVNEVYEYKIWKSEFEDISGQFLLTNDTTLNIQMITTGINEKLNNDFSMEIWPNPVKDVLNIKFHEITSQVTIKIIDLNGNIILTKKYESPHIRLKIDNIANGIYILNTTNKKRSYNNSIIIKKEMN